MNLFFKQRGRIFSIFFQIQRFLDYEFCERKLLIEAILMNKFWPLIQVLFIVFDI